MGTAGGCSGRVEVSLRLSCFAAAWTSQERFCDWRGSLVRDGGLEANESSACIFLLLAYACHGDGRPMPIGAGTFSMSGHGLHDTGDSD